MQQRKILAVCDSETAFSRGLALYLEKKYREVFEVKVFTGIPQLLSFYREETADLVLLDEKLYNPAEWQAREGSLLLCGSEGTGDREPAGIYKYQSAENIVQEIIKVLRFRGDAVGTTPGYKQAMQLITVYSPVNRCGKSSFALSLALALAGEVRTLFLDLSAWSRLFEGTVQEEAEGLSEVLYEVSLGKEDIPGAVLSRCAHLGKLDVLPPVKGPADLQDTPLKMWVRLLDELKLHSPYEALVLDLEQLLPAWQELLQMSDRIYMPYLPSERFRMELLEKYLRQTSGEEILSRSRKICMPPSLQAEPVSTEDLQYGAWKNFACSFLKDFFPDKRRE